MKKTFNETYQKIEKKFGLLENTNEMKNEMVESIENILGFKHESWFSFSVLQLEQILNKLEGSSSSKF
jgi:hypothetical protein